MSQDKDRHVVRRVITPPALPALVPAALTAAEHLAAHDVGADVLDHLVKHVGVDAGGARPSAPVAPASWRSRMPTRVDASPLRRSGSPGSDWDRRRSHRPKSKSGT